MSQVTLRVDNVSKKFCRSLKRSLWYGVKDLASEMLLLNRRRAELRPEEFWSLKDVSFELNRGETFGLIGHNGAGKSTLLKLINGSIRPDMGCIRVQGRVGALIELGMGFHPILTGRENIYINAAILGMRRQEVEHRLDDIIDFAEIGSFIDTPVQNYSSGMKARLGFAIAAHLDADVLLIDEVLSVGDAAFRERCINRLAAFKRNGGTIIFVSHNMVVVEAICDRALLLDHGHMADLGEPSDVIWKYEEKAMELSQQADLRLGRAPVSQSNDDFRVLAAEFRDLAGNPKTVFEFGESFEVHIHFEAAAAVKNPNCMITLQKGARSNPSLSEMSMLWDGTRLESLPRQGVVGCVIREPPMSPGVYHLHLCVLSGVVSTLLGKKKYLDWVELGSLTVVPGSLKERLPGAPPAKLLSQLAPLVLDYSWHLNGDPLDNLHASALQAPEKPLPTS